MIGIIKFVLGCLLSLVLLVPAAIVLGFIGLPVLIILAVLAIPLIAVLAVLGLPLLLVLIAGGALMAVVFGVLGVVFSMGVMIFKVLLFVMLPALIVWYALTRIIGGPARHHTPSGV